MVIAIQPFGWQVVGSSAAPFLYVMKPFASVTIYSLKKVATGTNGPAVVAERTKGYVLKKSPKCPFDQEW